MQARLRNLAQQRGDDVQALLIRFVLERLLHRLAASRHGDEFLLKGAMLFAAWADAPHRATRDLDLLGHGTPDLDRLAEAFRDIAATVVEPDGVVFDAGSVQAARIRDDQLYLGVRVTLAASVATARVSVQVDVGFGDAVRPAPVELRYPSLLGMPTPTLRAYPRETVVAEKFQAMVSLGELNSRMKDFYDLFTLAQRFAFAGAPLGDAIRATFERRSTELPRQEPIALRPEFAALRDKGTQWRAFVRRSRLLTAEVEFADVVASVHAFLWPVVRALAAGQAPPTSWRAGGPWS